MICAKNYWNRIVLKLFDIKLVAFLWHTLHSWIARARVCVCVCVCELTNLRFGDCCVFAITQWRDWKTQFHLTITLHSTPSHNVIDIHNITWSHSPMHAAAAAAVHRSVTADASLFLRTCNSLSLSLYLSISISSRSIFGSCTFSHSRHVSVSSRLRHRDSLYRL